MNINTTTLLCSTVMSTGVYVLSSTTAFSQANAQTAVEQFKAGAPERQAAAQEFRSNVQAGRAEFQAGAPERQAAAQELIEDLQAARAEWQAGAPERQAEFQAAAAQFQSTAQDVVVIFEENMNGIVDDLVTIQSDSAVTPEQVEAVKMSTMAVLTDIEQKPSDEAVAGMALEFQRAYRDGTITPEEMEAIQESMGEVMMRAGDSEESIEAMNDSVNELTEASGIDQDDVQLIVDGFKDMVIDIQEVIPE